LAQDCLGERQRQLIGDAQVLEHLPDAPSVRLRVLVELRRVEWAQDCRKVLARRNRFGAQLVLEISLR
jgi:hypothetical protein